MSEIRDSPTYMSNIEWSSSMPKIPFYGERRISVPRVIENRYSLSFAKRIPVVIVSTFIVAVLSNDDKLETSANDRGDKEYRMYDAQNVTRGRKNKKASTAVQWYYGERFITLTVRPEVPQRPRRFIAYTSERYLDYYWIHEMKN